MQPAWIMCAARAFMQRTIELPDEQARELERLAAQEHRSFEELVQLALDDYLARRKRDRSDWLRRFDQAVARIREGVPRDLTPEEIEAEISANWEEYRAERAAARRAGETAADAGGH
jgi:predicted transcriptional regulator